MLKILWKRGEIAPEEQFLLLSTIFCYLMLEFVLNRDQIFSSRLAIIRDNQSRDNESRLYVYPINPNQGTVPIQDSVPMVGACQFLIVKIYKNIVSEEYLMPTS